MTDFDLIHRIIKRTHRNAEDHVDSDSGMLKKVLERLVRGFQPNGSPWIQKSDLQTQRELKYKIEVRQAIVGILEPLALSTSLSQEDLPALKGALSYLEYSHKNAVEAHNHACQDLLDDFSRPGGPRNTSMTEFEWMRAEAHMDAFEDVLKRLAEVKEELAKV